VWLVEAIQAVVEMPLSLDSANPQALRAAIATTTKTPLINSISGEPARLKTILPLAAEHRCPVIALAMDANQISASAEERFAVVNRVMAATQAAGVPDRDVYIDPLVMTVGTNTKSALVTFEIMRRVRAAYPQAHLVLGLSNVSFGLPARSLINRYFLALAIQAGLDTAIMDPLDEELQAAVLATELLLDQDAHCLNFTRAWRQGRLGKRPAQNAPPWPPEPVPARKAKREDSEMPDAPQTFVPSPEYVAREKRFYDAVALRRPDRVPVASLAAFFVTRYGGITNAEAMTDYELMTKTWLEATKKLNWDMAPPPFVAFPAPVMELLGLRTFKWPGRHFKPNSPYQFVEAEYMLADEYDELLANPSDFVVRKMWPRLAETLEPMGLLPPLHWLSSGYTLIMLFSSILGAPPMQGMLEKLLQVGQEMNKANAAQGRLIQDLAEAGYPLITFAFAEAPFDWVSDMFRGLRGAMLDMHRQPDKLKAAIDLFTPFAIESAIMGAKMSGVTRIFIPLHRGSGGFMSNKQFEEFYWPSLKKVMLALIDEGLLPMPFLEGDYTPRLEYLQELPAGKVLGHFDVVELKKAKEMIGDTMCFWGNVPASTLVTGKPQQVKDYVKNLIDIFGDNGGLIIDGAVDGVPPESKPENVEAMMEAALEYGVYS